MEYQETLKKLSPCGLDCSRCADYEGGEITRLSRELREMLDNYERVAAMKAEKDPLFSGYMIFSGILSSFAGGRCGGCRSDNVTCPIVCVAKTCPKEKGIDFCCQCASFPCDGQFSGPTREKWIKRVNRMRQIGVADYYKEQAKLPRY